MKKVLVILYYFPPMGGSGVQRALKFVKYLPEFGWKPVILCPEAGVYPQMDYSFEQFDWFKDLQIHRVPNATPQGQKNWKTRLFNLFGENGRKVLRWLASWSYFPDNKIGWIKTAENQATAILTEQAFDAILSSGPPFSNHILAAKLSAKFKIPLFLDYRDAWAENHMFHFPTPYHRKKHRHTQDAVNSRANTVIAINEAIAQTLKIEQLAIEVISQGYDQEDLNLAQRLDSDPRLKDRSYRYLLHNGIFYNERRTREIFIALSLLIERNPDYRLKLVLQGGLAEGDIRKAKALGIEEHIIDLGYQPHVQSLANAMACDALMLLIGHRKKPEQIVTGKIFEYFAMAKPIVGCVPDGAASKLLKEYGNCFLAKPYEVEEIYEAFKSCYESVAFGESVPVDKEWVEAFERRNLTATLAHIMHSANIKSS